MSVSQHLDFDALNSLKEIMEDDFSFLVETFLSDSADRITALKSAVESEEVDNVRRSAHSFKGSCSNLGVLKLANLCAQIERKAVNGDIADLSAEIQEIEQEFAIIEKMLMDFMTQ
jgi:histidine phosphotransfer protein HptB